MAKEDEGLKLLKDCRNITHQIESLQEQIDSIYSMLTSTTVKPKEVDVQTSGASDPMADNVIKMMEYQQKLENYQADLCKKKSKVIDIIVRMDVKEQQLLTIRYLKGRTIEQTAEDFDRSYYRTWEALNKAEENFCKLFSKCDTM